MKRAVDAVAAAAFVGLDCETEDSRRHDGLNRFCKYKPDGTRPGNAKLVFDMNRTTMCGFSIYPEEGDTAWYVNLAHADVANRVPWNEARAIIDARKADAWFVCHNAPFELTVFKKALQHELERVICTLQMAVSTYGPDEYNKQAWINAGLGQMAKFVGPLMKHSLTYEGGDFDGDLADIVIKIIAKESRAGHSYNGFCAEHVWGYGLKQLVRSHFGREMTTFEQVLGDRAHMGQLTGEEVVAYGAEDAYWVIPTMRKLMAMMAVHAPNAMRTFFTQENPMIHVYSDIRAEGVRINKDILVERRAAEREKFAVLLGETKGHVRQLLPFAQQPDERLIKREKWYSGKNGDAWKRYRAKITDWAKTPDLDDPYKTALQVRGAVTSAWAAERGEEQQDVVNLTHYMPMRTLLYDLIGAPLIMSKGKVQSNGEARGKIGERLAKKHAEIAKKRLVAAEEGSEDIAAEDDDEEEGESDDLLLVVDEIEIEQQRREHGISIIENLTKMSGCEQRMKLFLTPYIDLTDPETNCMYPEVSSMLATRRMAGSNPNTMQLQKRGEGVYVREAFEGDTDDHVVGSIDWSGIELVIVGELSGDPEFKKAFGQLPHEDLHSGTASSVLAVEVPLLSEVSFRAMKASKDWVEWQQTHNVDCEIRRLVRKVNGEVMDTPSDAFKYWRNEVGKISNFNYWFSGWLGTVGEKMGWSQDQTAEAVNRFRDRFAVAEAWRVGTIEEGRRQGWVELPDGHRRYRWEATEDWMEHFLAKWPDGGAGFNLVIQQIARKIQKRAWNQLVNARVQGTCATIAKRSLIRIREMIKREGFRARVMFPVHDELVFSVHREDAAEFMIRAREIMIDHKDIFPTLALDASPAIGLNFSAMSKINPYGQIELFEPPAEVVGKELAMTRLDKAGIQRVVDYLFQDQMRMAA